MRMRYPALRRQAGNLVTAKEAAARKKSLGLEGAQKPRGIGWAPPPDTGETYSNKQRMDDARRAFIPQCARAYVAGTLTARSPGPPIRIAHEIRKSGGNIRWLYSTLTANMPFTANTAVW
jgi:hypothetical protein